MYTVFHTVVVLRNDFVIGIAVLAMCLKLKLLAKLVDLFIPSQTRGLLRLDVRLKEQHHKRLSKGMWLCSQ